MYDEKPENAESEMSPRDALEQAMGEGDVDAVLARLKELGFHLMANTEMSSQDAQAETAKTGEPDEMDEDEAEDEGSVFTTGLDKLRSKTMQAVKEKYGDF